ncbi:MAG: hypothetical protein UY32_C0015G0010 [Candidatus Jorgensenbacteria bacterium GW2011_GWC1_48_8]|uniref:Methyltransferase type 11 domain-containing protein n=1 Tax=Candidatus Jorgensenbacteria bacterium GW2011_GWC1_48_8 TaxID=1618666 RepID=A0A0G1XWT2_9BACT|nr:MAG: Methyltransferase type 11 [Parcubacteria group bacterium GW2011_GWB1_45_10]KKU98755.1 MAG: hypothetical protein UY32_C0015G0010 [Candidatus Jorgensenbacteria bacterium GW2011_GWC1_48_8]
MLEFLRKHKKLVYLFLPTLRISSVGWISTMIELRRQFNKLKPGIVLDIGGGDAPYKKFVPHTKYMTLDVDKSSNPDILSDAHNIQWQSNYFDTIISIETLEHLREPQKSINEIYRLLKPGGVCVLSTRFLHPYHPGPEDHYRFTWDSLRHLFRKFDNIEIYHVGNRLQLFHQFINFVDSENFLKQFITTGMAIFLNILNPIFARIRFKKTKFPLGFVVYARK